MTTPAYAPWAPGGVVPAPEEQPSEAGLTAVANVDVSLQIPSASTDRWELGYTYAPRRASKARNRSQLSNAYGENIAGDQGPLTVQTVPWLIEVEHTVSTFGFNYDDWPAYVEHVMELYTSKALEHELWTGEIAQMDGTPNRYLASSDAIVVGSGAYDSVKRAIASLVRAASDEGVASLAIHMPRDVAIMSPGEWAATDTLQKYGFAMVPGAGYPGTGPDGAAPAADTSWIYATELPNVRLSGVVGIPDEISEAVDRSKNEITFYAERFGSVDFAGPVFASRVSL